MQPAGAVPTRQSSSLLAFFVHMFSATTRQPLHCACVSLRNSPRLDIRQAYPTHPPFQKERDCLDLPCHNTTPLPRGWTDARTRRATIPHHHLPAMVMAAVTVIVLLLLLPIMPRPLPRRATTRTRLPIIAATEAAVIPAVIPMIATSSRAVLTTTRCLRDPQTRIPPSAALTHSVPPRAISTFARRNPGA